MESDNRNYGIWVIGGHFRTNHPILTLPNPLNGELGYADMWAFQQAMGQVATQTATREQIAKSGLPVIKGVGISHAVSDGSVLTNCADQCLICLSEYEDSEDCRILTCKHAFHAACVDKWMLTGRNACPACRTTAVDVSGPEEMPDGEQQVASGLPQSSMF